MLTSRQVELLRRNLPKTPDVRWTPGRKANVAAAVQAGVVSLEEAQKRFDLTAEELHGWLRRYAQSGVAGLRTRRS